MDTSPAYRRHRPQTVPGQEARQHESAQACASFFRTVDVARGGLCRVQRGQGGSDSGPAASRSELSGEITIDGSSTVAPLTSAAAELFNADNPNVQIAVGTSGTGGGFQKFCAGETDMSDASRPIKDDDAARVLRARRTASSTRRSRSPTTASRSSSTRRTTGPSA